MLYYVTSPLWNLTMFSVKRVQMAMHMSFAWGATMIFSKFQLAGQPPQTPQIPHFGGGATHGLRCGILLCPR